LISAPDPIVLQDQQDLLRITQMRRAKIMAVETVELPLVNDDEWLIMVIKS